VKVLGIDAQILLQVHDSIVVQCKPEDVKRVVAVMHEANDFNQDGIVIPLEAKVGPNWDACKEVVNG
jgi:DNA polymerase I-like protein with 3'-5' exonuclease and polymerase domains